MVAQGIVGIGIYTRRGGAQITAILLGENPVTQSLGGFDELWAPCQGGFQLAPTARLGTGDLCCHGLGLLFQSQAKAMKLL
jgi:hypothetical protein